MFTEKVMRVVVLSGLLLNCRLLPVAATPLLSITPASPVVQPGQNFSLAISITAVLDLYAWQFDLAFDPIILSAGAITEGPFLAAGGNTVFLPGTIDNSAGSITFTAHTLQTALLGVDGSGILATIDFQALALGTSAITLSNLILLNSNLNNIIVKDVYGAVTVRQPVTGVPEPHTWLLLATSLVGLFGYGWRRGQRGA